jgi:hypothetical protein
MLCTGLTRKIEIQFRKKLKISNTSNVISNKSKDSNDSFYDTMKIVL